MNVWKTLEESMNMNGMNDMRPRCIIPESFENAYSYFEDLALLYDKVNNITVDSNKIWKPTVSQSGVISWNRSEDETEPSPVNIKGPQGIQGNEGPQGPRGNDGARGPAGPSGENGVDGFSPVVEVFPIQGGHQVNITDATHSESFNVMDGTPGADNTNVWRPTVADNGEISWEKSNVATAPAPMNIMGPQGPAGNDGLPGVNGESGFSPYVNVTPITNGYEVNITDANGTQTFNLYNGARGEQGPAGNDGLPGVNGESGFSPYVNVAPITNGYEVNITDANGTQTFNLYNGAPGQSGEPGPRGNDGESGFSPYVNVTPITNGYEVNITDANGTQTFNLYNGATGEQGPRGNDGESGFSPYVNVTAITNGHEVNITDVNGVHSFNVYDGQLGEQGPRGNDGSPGLNGVDGFSPVITVTALNDGTRNYNRVNITSAGGTNSFNVYDGTNGSGGGGGNSLELYYVGSASPTGYWYKNGVNFTDTSLIFRSNVTDSFYFNIDRAMSVYNFKNITGLISVDSNFSANRWLPYKPTAAVTIPLEYMNQTSFAVAGGDDSSLYSTMVMFKKSRSSSSPFEFSTHVYAANAGSSMVEVTGNYFTGYAGFINLTLS